MTLGLLGRKVGMTQIFAADGTSVPVTVVAIEPNTVTKLRTPDRDGYTAVQVGIEAGKRRLNKPDLGQFKGAASNPFTNAAGKVVNANSSYGVSGGLGISFDVLNADSLIAMTSHRPFRRAMPLSDAFAELTRYAGIHYDEKVGQLPKVYL